MQLANRKETRCAKAKNGFKISCTGEEGERSDRAVMKRTMSRVLHCLTLLPVNQRRPSNESIANLHEATHSLRVRLNNNDTVSINPVCIFEIAGHREKTIRKLFEGYWLSITR